MSHIIGEPTEAETRWQLLTQSGCRTGAERYAAWSMIPTEMTESASHLSEELEAMFNVEVVGVGEERPDGSLKGLISEKMETVRARVLRKALESFPDQKARPVLVLSQLDKLITAWMQALPGPFSGFTGPVSLEAMCASLSTKPRLS